MKYQLLIKQIFFYYISLNKNEVATIFTDATDFDKQISS